MRVLWASRLYGSGSLAGADTASDVGESLGASDLLPVDFGAVNVMINYNNLKVAEKERFEAF